MIVTVYLLGRIDRKLTALHFFQDHTPPPLTVACQRNNTPADTLIKMLEKAQHRRGVRVDVFTCEIETVATMRKTIAANQTISTILRNTHSQGTASACHIAARIDDLSFITPNHILCLNTRSTCPPGVFSKDDLYVKRRWRQVQYLAKIFWQRWSKEYLSSLQERQKWVEPKRNVSKNDIVLIVENSWSLGRIIDVKHDKNGLARIASVKTQTTTLDRPIHKLCMIMESDS